MLLSQSLPGYSQPISFPDLSFVLGHSEIFLVDEHLSGPMSIEGSPKPIRILSNEALLAEAQRHGDISYLRFQPPEVNGDTVRVTLEARIAPSDPNKGILGLSSIHVSFSRVADAWKVADGPVYSAAEF